MNKKFLLLFVFLLVGRNSFGFNNYLNQFMEWWDGDKISINSKHSKIFKRHIKARGWDSAEKRAEKENFIEDINDENFESLVGETIEQLKQYDNIVKLMSKDNDFSLDYFENEFIELTKNNLKGITDTLNYYGKKLESEYDVIVFEDDQNFIRLIKFLPIVENLFQIFHSIDNFKNQNFSLLDIYNLFESNIPAGRAKFYFDSFGNLEEVFKYAKSAIKVRNLKTKLDEDRSPEALKGAYNTVLNEKVIKYKKLLNYDDEYVRGLIKKGVHLTTLQSLLNKGIENDKAIKFAIQVNMTPNTVNFLVAKEI